MANNFKNTDLVTKIAVKEFLNASVLIAKVDRQLDGQFRKVGASIDVRRPVMFEATDGAAISSASDIEERAVTVMLDKRKKVNFEVTSQDMTLNVEDMTERYIKPAMIELAQKVELDIAAEYKNIATFTGTPGTAPSTLLEIAKAGALLTSLGVEKGSRCLAVDADTSVTLANGLKDVYPGNIAKKAIEEATVGRYGGFDIYESNSLAVHTVGALGGTPLVKGANQNTTYALAGDSGQQSLIVDGWSNSVTNVLLAGDVFTIAGVNSVNRRTRVTTGKLQTFTITANASSNGSGETTLTISPAIIISGPYQTVAAAPADNAALVIKTGAANSSHVQNLGFHKNAITLAMAPLDMPTDGASASRASYDNVSIRAVRQYDITNDKTVFRFDILYGTKVQNEGYAMRLTS